MTLIRVIDLETTGTAATDEVVEIGAVDVGLQTHTQQFEGEIEILNSNLIKPTKPIPPEASAVHHLTDDDVRDALSWNEVWPNYIEPKIGLYAAHNAAFEGIFLTDSMRKGAPLICTYKAALRVWPSAPNHKNQTLRYWLQSQPGSGIPKLEFPGDPHRAGHDAYVTAWILVALLKAGATLEKMRQWTQEPALLPTCPIGEEWRGKPWPHVEYSFLTWIIKKIPDQDIVWNAKHELERRAVAQEAKKQTTVPDSDVAIRRKAYVTMAKSALAVAATVDDLEKWFRDERSEHFHLYGITPSTEEFTEIVIACKQHKEQLLKQKTEQSVLRAQLETERAAA